MTGEAGMSLAVAGRKRDRCTSDTITW